MKKFLACLAFVFLSASFQAAQAPTPFPAPEGIVTEGVPPIPNRSRQRRDVIARTAPLFLPIGILFTAK